MLGSSTQFPRLDALTDYTHPSPDSPAPPPLPSLPAAMDVEGVCAQYSGRGLLERLVFACEKSEGVARTEIQRALLAAVKRESRDVILYERVARGLPNESGLLSESEVEAGWIWVAATRSENAVIKARLEGEIRAHSAGMLRESLRVGHMQLGTHLKECGLLSDALKAFGRARDYCATPAATRELCLAVVAVCIPLHLFNHAQSYILKAAATPSQDQDDAVLQYATALVHLDARAYRKATLALLLVPVTSPSAINHLVSPNDIAIYGVLLALATLDRPALKTRAIDNPAFKHYLELEPPVREALLAFYDARYADCLRAIDSFRPALALDQNMAPHLDEIYALIRKRALIHYFQPFTSVTMASMAAALNTNSDNLESQIVSLIHSGDLNARLDKFKKVLYSKQINKRSRLFANVTSMGIDYSRSLNMAIFRMKLVKAGIVVRDDKS